MKMKIKKLQNAVKVELIEESTDVICILKISQNNNLIFHLKKTKTNTLNSIRANK